MPDFYDKAQETEELFREIALAERRVTGPAECGECLNCGNPLKQGRWCDIDCRDEWQEDHRRLNGVR